MIRECPKLTLVDSFPSVFGSWRVYSWGELVSSETIHIAYLGEAVEDGSMDVRDLAPALLAIGKLCEQATAW